jgi:hypothetical protein
MVHVLLGDGDGCRVGDDGAHRPTGRRLAASLARRRRRRIRVGLISARHVDL